MLAWTRKRYGIVTVMTVHQIAYLQPKLMVAWKCLSLQAFESRSIEHFAPVAYCSRSDRFFPDLLQEPRPASGGVLWVVSRPTYRSGGKKKSFPPTLTAKIVIDEVVSGEVVRHWADDCDADLGVPPGEGQEFQSWRRAESVEGDLRRAVFRITRDWARNQWREYNHDRNKARGKTRKPLSQLGAWKKVRTALADPTKSRFLAHIDVTACLSTALAASELVDLPTDKRGPELTRKLQSPIRLSDRDESCVTELQELARRGSEGTFFLNYRWNERREDVERIGAALVDQDRGVWLDRLQIPDFKERPVWRLQGEVRRRHPPRVELEQLLAAAVRRSSVFLCLAWEDYHADGENWARKEREIAEESFRKRGRPLLGLVDLGGAPEGLRAAEGLRWRYEGDPADLARRISQKTR